MWPDCDMTGDLQVLPTDPYLSSLPTGLSSALDAPPRQPVWSSSGGGPRSGDLRRAWSASMGDFLAPKRRDVVDRLRRRIEQYRHHHFNSVGRFNVGRPALYEQQKQDTELFHHRWLENKAKKAAKQSKVKDSGGGGGGGGPNSQSDHRNLVTVSDSHYLRCRVTIRIC